MNELEGKVAVVTGGLSGLGRQVSQLFAERGASVVVGDALDRSRDDDMPAGELVSSLAQEGLFVQGDVRSGEDIDRLFDAALERFGRVDVLVCSAGVIVFKPLAELTVEDYELVMDVNVKGTFLCCRRAIAEMKKQPERGVIVTVASNFAFVAAAEASVYCASKGAVATLTKALALETGPDGIRVNALCPGAMITQLNAAHRARADVMASWAEKTPLRTVGRDEFLGYPSEVARSALFLASDASQYMTGTLMIVDGGWNAQ